MLNNGLKKSLVIGKYTFKEIIGSKILYNTLFLGLALLLVTYVAFSFTYGEPSRVALDFGMGCLALSSIGIAIFIGVGILSKEIDSRTVYMIVSRPVPRFSFILGKFLGLSLVLILNIIILSFITLSLFFLIGGVFSPLILWTIVFIIIESLVVLCLVGMLSIVTTQTMSVLYTIMLYILGHSIDTAMTTNFVKNRPEILTLLEGYHFVLPAFYKFNIKSFLLYENNLSSVYLGSTFSYGLVYIIFLILISIYIFEKKNLD